MSIFEVYELRRLRQVLDQRVARVGLLILLVASAGALKGATLAYMETSASQFGAIDLTTGLFTLIGNTSTQLQGLGVAGGTLYGLTSSGALNRVNTANGNLTVVGSSPHTYNVFGSTLTGLYAIDTATNVYLIDPATGAATLLGPTGVSFGSVDGLSTNSSTLYWADGTNFYKLNTTTGAAMLVGSMGGVVLGAMVLEGGVLYGGEFSPLRAVVTVDATTGGLTPGPSLSGTPNNFFGLAPSLLASVVPEPGTWTLLAAGIAGMMLRRGRTKRATRS